MYTLWWWETRKLHATWSCHLTYSQLSSYPHRNGHKYFKWAGIGTVTFLQCNSGMQPQFWGYEKWDIHRSFVQVNNDCTFRHAVRRTFLWCNNIDSYFRAWKVPATHGSRFKNAEAAFVAATKLVHTFSTNSWKGCKFGASADCRAHFTRKSTPGAKPRHPGCLILPPLSLNSDVQ
jgi:hypothetical protein